MTEVGLRHLFAAASTENYTVHFFRDYLELKEALSKRGFFSVIYSLSGSREQRREGLVLLSELSQLYPKTQRIILANDEREARLVSHLAPSGLHGIISKTASLDVLQAQLVTLLRETRRVNVNAHNHWYVSSSRMLSPTERAILQFMAYGYSMPEIATQLARNIKTIRAHKFNAMTKLGVSSDMGLLHAADILINISVPGEDYMMAESAVTAH
ncbi:bgl operon transcriptional regulator BglJ [Superficieibacter electus]|uniref:Bgl operon transcriptional regulator BglJ n=1 Tax=Superficieibacter electus TaxID=2022662 RepID=A0A2P5GQM3_9ENTR|nr:DNA-binding transcriptional activator BglJ [Superficieibacter electus]POP45678.1 bgl operon transcriptional regulator BglJ [Superficieibacter electus]POP48839.1 bgl operon transcriptional regulator BglJ [Superficieibacter electus]